MQIFNLIQYKVDKEEVITNEKCFRIFRKYCREIW